MMVNEPMDMRRRNRRMRRSCVLSDRLRKTDFTNV
jgi:hypothetical protein